jgi:hypothetical protein
MKLKAILTASALAVASLSSLADTGGGALDLSLGNASFGRDNASGSFVDTYSFTLTGSSYVTSGTASSAASGASQDLDFSSVVITMAATPGTPVLTFAGNLGTDFNEFFSLEPTALDAGNYLLIVKGINTPDMASYDGTLAITAAVPEPETYALMLAGFGAMGFIARRRNRKG